MLHRRTFPFAAISKTVSARKGVELANGNLTFTAENKGLNGKRVTLSILDIAFVYLGNKANMSATIGNLPPQGGNLGAVIVAGALSPAAGGAVAAASFRHNFFVMMKDQSAFYFQATTYSKKDWQSFLACLQADGVQTFIEDGVYKYL